MYITFFVSYHKKKTISGHTYPIDFYGICVKFKIKSKNVIRRDPKSINENFFRYVAEAIDPMEHWLSHLEENALQAGAFGAFTGAIIMWYFCEKKSNSAFFRKRHEA